MRRAELAVRHGYSSRVARLGHSFDCYPSGTVIFAQLGVLSNIEAAMARS